MLTLCNICNCHIIIREMLWRCCGMIGLTESMVSRACMLFPVFRVFFWRGSSCVSCGVLGGINFATQFRGFLRVRLVAVSRLFRSVNFECARLSKRPRQREVITMLFCRFCLCSCGIVLLRIADVNCMMTKFATAFAATVLSISRFSREVTIQIKDSSC